MNEWIYLGAVLFGAFSLLIEADRNYRTTLGNSPFPYHAILEDVELENLCTPREWMAGFLFYSLLYLLAYAIILSSTELFLLVRSANLAELEVGAHTNLVGPMSDPLELADSTYGKPIFVSAFLIAFLSMGAMKPVETYMRALAHRLAGVPRGVYNVLERLQAVDYLELNKKHPSPLLQRYAKLTKTAAYKKVSDQYDDDIKAQLSTIDCLAPSVTAGFSRLHFPLTHFDAFKDVPQQLADEVKEVENLLDGLEAKEKSFKDLHEKAVLTSNSAKAVFAVFYVRNNHAIKNTDQRSTIAKIDKRIARGYRTELNAFAMSMFFGVLVTLFISFLTYHWRSQYTVDDRVSLAETEIEAAWNDDAPESTLTLPDATVVLATLTKETKGSLTLEAGQSVEQQVLGGKTESKVLEQDRTATVVFLAEGTADIPLRESSKVTILELPLVDNTPQRGLPRVDVAGRSGVDLPAETQGRITLKSDLTIPAKLPTRTVATVEFEGGAMATTELGEDTLVDVTLKAGDQVGVKFSDTVRALTPTRGRDTQAATQAELVSLPTWPTCLANLTSPNTAENDPGSDGSAQLSEACQTAEQEGKASWITGQYSRIVKWSFWDVLQRGLMVFATIVATIFFREVRVDQNSWKPWSFRRIPFLRLLSMSVSPALIGVFALSSAYVIALVWDSNFSVTQRQITDLFQRNWVYFAWHLVPCMILSITALILMDKHEDWPVEASLATGLICAVILVLMSWVIFMVNTSTIDKVRIAIPFIPGSWTIGREALRDTIVTATMPSVFIVMFAAFLEMTEENRSTDWLIIRVLKAPVVRLKEAIGPKVSKTSLIVLVVVVLGSIIAVVWGQGAAAQTSEPRTDTNPITENDAVTKKDESSKVILRIGVRSDARPFSYRSKGNFDVLTAATPGPLAQDKYTGYIIKICDAVLTDLMANPRDPDSSSGTGDRLVFDNIEIVDVDDLIESDPETSRFEYFGDKFDILCDPSTITNERRSGMILSPPLFLSGISFIDLHKLAKPPSDGCPKLPLIGVVGNTTAANNGIRAILEADELPRYRNLLIDWLDDNQNQCAKGREGYEAVEVLASHAAAAKAFCDKKFHYYLGDQEIIVHSARQIPGCEFDQTARTFTTDRYAIFGKIDYSDPERALWVARFFEVLSQKVPFNPSILDIAFSDTFVGTDKSRALELFFWSVRGPK